ncbi:helix-turn-helix domain-containing protein [Ferribacterium limneticum]|uniref:helix-turn-helix domain-containing protein n=1 Tax=Ferribacterium limneticum TaxID=76259 RepID=UPI001CFBA887|nr:helix-turn-helix domain-containing protein [Ferribacterium limneticum]UCV17835.1 helix-turn-helix domain-containing protein [Ferribacterium limneticum]
MAAVSTVCCPAEQGSFVDYREFSRELNRCHLHWNIKPISRHGFQARFRRREVGPLVFSEIEYEPISGARGMSDINRRDDCVIGLTFFVKGTVAFNQGGRELLLQADELLLWDGMRPGGVRSWDTVECKTILFPRDLVCQHIGNVDDLTGQKIGQSSGMGLLLKSHIKALHQSVGLIAPRDQANVLRATFNLLEACFRPTEATLTGTAYRKALFRRIEDFMRDTLLDPVFSPTTIAAAFGFTPRYLHRIFAEAGTTFSEWVRKERLARAESALTNPSFAGESITNIAHRFGFCDAAHFSNLFKARFGQPPSAYRNAVSVISDIRGHRGGVDCGL